MKTRVVKTFWVELCLAGDIEVAKQACREFVHQNERCVTVEPCEYIYTGGQESGYRVRFVNYPRFPTKRRDLLKLGHALAGLLMRRTFQQSALLITPTITKWISSK